MEPDNYGSTAIEGGRYSGNQSATLSEKRRDAHGVAGVGEVGVVEREPWIVKWEAVETILKALSGWSCSLG